MDDLLEIMRRLRDPQHGCPWDLEQDFSTIAPYTLEEAYEVADVIEREAFDELPDELGDLLFQVVFYTQMAGERGWFGFDDVLEAICEKMRRRHPHVFGDERRGNAEGQLQRWEAIKAAERADQPRQSLLADVTVGLPALPRAGKIGARAARVGFDWPDATEVLKKLDEERSELGEALASGDRAAIEDELGDLLFTVAQLARHLKLDASQALRASTRKFEQRFAAMERRWSSDDSAPEARTAEEWEAAWRLAKDDSRTFDGE